MSALSMLDRRSGRNRHQEAQRQATRDRILRAAETVFEARTYIAATVEEIVAEAGVSRAAFYSHFDGKSAVLQLLLEDFSPMLTAYYRRLPGVDARDEEAVTAWVDGLVALFAARRPIAFALTQAALLEPGFFDMLGGRRGELVALLVAAMPSFAAAEPVSAAITVHQLDQFAYYAAMGKWGADRDAAVRFMARQLQRFIRDNQPLSSR